MDWINTAWAWVEQNITPLLTTANIALVLNVILSLFKQKRTLTDNTFVTRDLKTALADNKAQYEQVTALKKEVDDLTDALSAMTIKNDAILDILETVYRNQPLSASTKDKVQMLHTNARYETSKARATILKELEEMKAKDEQAAKEREAKAEKIKKLVGDAPADKPAVNLK